MKLAGDLLDEVKLARGHEDRIFRPLAIDLQEANRLASVAGDAVDDAIERLRRNGRSVLGKEERRLSRVVSSFGTRHCQDIADSVRTPDAAVFEGDGFSKGGGVFLQQGEIAWLRFEPEQAPGPVDVGRQQEGTDMRADIDDEIVGLESGEAIFVFKDDGAKKSAIDRLRPSVKLGEQARILSFNGTAPQVAFRLPFQALSCSAILANS